MGCDIHLYVERKNGSDTWVCADKWTANKYKDEEGELDFTVKHEDLFYTRRNYNLFAMFADVRNGEGFAGCDTGDPLVPICEPRGLPCDVTERVRSTSDSWGIDGHSHSHLTVQELLNYDWTQVSTQRGWIDAKSYAKWISGARERGEGPPTSSGGVFGHGVRHVSEEEMDAIIDPIREKYRERGGAWLWPFLDACAEIKPLPYTKVSWHDPYWRCAGGWWSSAMPRLVVMARRAGGFDRVRIVFWFDN